VQRILKNTSATLKRTFTVDGTATDADGDVTVTITDAAGTEVVAETNSTSVGSGVYTYLLAPQSNPSRLTATWSGSWSGVSQTVTDTVLVVGGHLFTEVEARAFHDAAMSSASTYSDAAIAEARDRITDTFSEVTGVAFVPTYEYETLEGTGGRVLYARWPRISDVLSASIGGTAQTASDLVAMRVPSNGIYHKGRLWPLPTTSDPRNVTVGYVHGWTTVPGQIKRAALTVLRYELVDSNIGDRTVSLTDEIGTIRVAQPGFRGAAYGIPAVDATLERYSERMPV
jgi:hypothetical protein